MASSGSKSVEITSWNTLKFNWWTVSQSVTNNKTVVGWNLQLVAGSSGTISSTASKDWSVTVNGTNYSGTNTIGVSANSTKTLASGQTTVTHDADGTKSFSYSFSQEFGITFSGASIGTRSGSGTGTLNTIPRATTPTLSASSVNMGAAVTINTPRASSSFTHDLAYAFAGGSYVSIATGIGTSHSWTVPLSLADKIPNATSGTVTIRCITKSGSTTIGTKTVLLTAKVPSSVVPTISAVATVEATSGIAAQFGLFVQNKSKVKATITAAGARSSTIKSYSTTFAGKTYTGATWTSGVVTQSGTLNLVTTVTDSRGRQAKKTTTISVSAYSPPKVSAFSVIRTDAAGAADQDGEYLKATYAYSVAALGGKNTAAMRIEWKKGTDTAWTSLKTGTALSANTAEAFASPSFSLDYEYDVRIIVTDWFDSSATYAAVLPSDAVIFDLRADGLGISFFKTCDKEGVEIVGQLPHTFATIAAGTDLDDLTTPGFYAFSASTYATMLNVPIGGTASGSVEVKAEGEAGQVRQVVTRCSASHREIWERLYYSNTWQEWLPVFKGGTTSRILWSGGMLMTSGHRIELTGWKKISAQPNGIVLVFSRYSASTVRDYHFNHAFVHKEFVKSMPGVGSTFLMTTDGSFSVMATKYIYISDELIVGNDVNSESGTGTSGVKYENGGFVLRYVLGV